MTEAERRALARAKRMTLRKSRLGETEFDLSPVFGADAISLVHRLTLASYALAGYAPPAYSREQIPCRFVPRRAT